MYPEIFDLKALFTKGSSTVLSVSNTPSMHRILEYRIMMYCSCAKVFHFKVYNTEVSKTEVSNPKASNMYRSIATDTKALHTEVVSNIRVWNTKVWNTIQFTSSCKLPHISNSVSKQKFSSS